MYFTLERLFGLYFTYTIQSDQVILNKKIFIEPSPIKLSFSLS